MVRFGQAEAADRRSRAQARKPALLLFRRAELADRVHHERALHRRERTQPGIAPLQFLQDQAVGDVAQARAPVVGEGGAEDPHRSHLGHQRRGKGPRTSVVPDQQHRAGVHPAPHRLARRPFLLGQEVLYPVEIEFPERGHASLLATPLVTCCETMSSARGCPGWYHPGPDRVNGSGKFLTGGKSQGYPAVSRDAAPKERVDLPVKPIYRTRGGNERLPGIRERASPLQEEVREGGHPVRRA